MLSFFQHHRHLSPPGCPSLTPYPVLLRLKHNASCTGSCFSSLGLLIIKLQVPNMSYKACTCTHTNVCANNLSHPLL